MTEEAKSQKEVMILMSQYQQMLNS